MNNGINNQYGDNLMKKTYHFILPIFLASQICTVQAENLQQIYELALDSDPSLKSTKAERLSVYEAKPQAFSQFLPSITFGAETKDNDVNFTQPTLLTDQLAAANQGDSNSSDTERHDFNTNSYQIQLTQPIFNYGNHISWQQVDNILAQADANLVAAEQDLILRTAQAYFNVLISYNNLEFSKVEKTATQRHLEQTRKRYEVGLIAGTDVSEAKARYDNSVADEIASQNNLANSLESLREITGQYHTELSALGDNMPLLPPDPQDIEQWKETAIRQNPNIISAQNNVERARKEIKLQRANHFPTLDLVAAREYEDKNLSSSESPLTGGGDRVQRNDSLALQFSLSLYSGGAIVSKTRQATHDYHKAQNDLETQQRTVVSQTRQAYNDVMASTSRVTALKQAVVSNKESFEATQAGFEVGTRTIVEVLNSQRDYHRSERDYKNERYNYILNTLRLKQAAGMLSAEDIVNLNQWLTGNVNLAQ